MRSVDADERRARNVENRLQIPIDEFAIVLVDLRLVSEAKGRFPPRDVVIARDGDDPAHPLGVAHERRRPLKLTSSGALSKITRYRDHLELPLMDDLLDGLDLLWHRWPTEMQIRDVENGRHVSIRLWRDDEIREVPRNAGRERGRECRHRIAWDFEHREDLSHARVYHDDAQNRNARTTVTFQSELDRKQSVALSLQTDESTHL